MRVIRELSVQRCSDQQVISKLCLSSPGMQHKTEKVLSHYLWSGGGSLASWVQPSSRGPVPTPPPDFEPPGWWREPGESTSPAAGEDAPSWGTAQRHWTPWSGICKKNKSHAGKANRDQCIVYLICMHLISDQVITFEFEGKVPMNCKWVYFSYCSMNHRRESCLKCIYVWNKGNGLTPSDVLEKMGRSDWVLLIYSLESMLCISPDWMY